MMKSEFKFIPPKSMQGFTLFFLQKYIQRNACCAKRKKFKTDLDLKQEILFRTYSSAATSGNYSWK